MNSLKHNTVINQSCPQTDNYTTPRKMKENILLFHHKSSSEPVMLDNPPSAPVSVLRWLLREERVSKAWLPNHHHHNNTHYAILVGIWAHLITSWIAFILLLIPLLSRSRLAILGSISLPFLSRSDLAPPKLPLLLLREEVWNNSMLSLLRLIAAWCKQ